ncbi:MAG: adenylate kinase [Lachnoclostridium sp.]|jgi:adenylate kinase|nr:adenylate kinase [Lachnoclostridium sp.]
MKIVMLGAPGVGKGTQAKRISIKYNIPHISTGDIFRANIKSNTKLGEEAKTYIDQGLLVPDELTLKLVMDRFAKDDAKKGYVLDGFPRTIPQAKALENALFNANDKLGFAINIILSDDEIISRMAGRRVCIACGSTYNADFKPPQKEGICDECGGEVVLRDDDKPETVKKRLVVYREQTEPLIDFYEKAGILHNIHGKIGMEMVTKEIIKILGSS